MHSFLQMAYQSKKSGADHSMRIGKGGLKNCSIFVSLRAFYRGFDATQHKFQICL